jgi:hypothetical protein
MGRSPVQGVLLKCQNEFIVSEVGSESKQAEGSGSLNIEQKPFQLLLHYIFCIILRNTKIRNMMSLLLLLFIDNPTRLMCF